MKNTLYALLIFVATNTHAASNSFRFEKDSSVPLVYLNFVIKSGSAHDISKKSGITNFLGEILLRGTTTRDKKTIDQTLDQIGATLDVEVRSEAMIFRGAVLSSKLESFLEIFSDILINPSFPLGEVRKLKSEITSQILADQSKDSSLAKLHWDRFLFNTHPYSNPILGKPKQIQAISKDDLKAHYANLFNQENVLFIGTGDADESFILEWFERTKEKLSNKTSIKSIAAPVIENKKRILIVDKPDRTQTQVFIGQAGLKMTDKDFFPIFLSNHIFGGGSFNARLMTEIRVKRGWSYGAYSYFKHGVFPRSWQAYYFPASKDTVAAVQLGLELIKKWKDAGISPEEFEFGKSSLINNSGFMYNTPKKRVENALLESTLQLPDGFMKSYGKELKNVSLEDANRAVNRFITPETVSILVLGTAKKIKTPLAKALNVSESEIEVVPFNKE